LDESLSKILGLKYARKGVSSNRHLVSKEFGAVGSVVGVVSGVGLPELQRDDVRLVVDQLDVEERAEGANVDQPRVELLFGRGIWKQVGGPVFTVARWNIFKPKCPICVNFGGP
jgi:hypothetical protein